MHHIQPFRTFGYLAGVNDSYLRANDLSNLVTLCPACHRQAESQVRIKSSLAGLASVLRNLAPLFLMCAPHDLGVHADAQSKLAEGQPVVVLYEQVPAGVGFSERLFELHDEIMLRTYQLVRDCECQDGCPSCVGPGGEQGAGSKAETLAILKLLVGKE